MDNHAQRPTETLRSNRQIELDRLVFQASINRQDNRLTARSAGAAMRRIAEWLSRQGHRV